MSVYDKYCVSLDGKLPIWVDSIAAVYGEKHRGLAEERLKDLPLISFIKAEQIKTHMLYVDSDVSDKLIAEFLDRAEISTADFSDEELKSLQEDLFGYGHLRFLEGIENAKTNLPLEHLMKYVNGEVLPEYRLNGVKKLVERFGGTLTENFNVDRASNFGGMKPSLTDLTNAYAVLVDKANAHIKQYSEEYAELSSFERKQQVLGLQAQASMLRGVAKIMGGELGQKLMDSATKLAETGREDLLAREFQSMHDNIFTKLADQSFDKSPWLYNSVLSYLESCGIDACKGKHSFLLSAEESKVLYDDCIFDEKVKALFPNAEQIRKIKDLLKRTQNISDVETAKMGNYDEVVKRFCDIGMSKKEAVEQVDQVIGEGDAFYVSTFLCNGNPEEPVAFAHFTPLGVLGRTSTNVLGIHEILHVFEGQFYEKDGEVLFKTGLEVDLKADDKPEDKSAGLDTVAKKSMTEQQKEEPRNYEMVNEVVHQQYNYRVVDELAKRGGLLVDSPFDRLSRGMASYDRAIGLVDPFVEAGGQALSDALVARESFLDFEQKVGRDFLSKYSGLLHEYVHGCGLFPDREKSSAVAERLKDLITSSGIAKKLQALLGKHVQTSSQNILPPGQVI